MSIREEYHKHASSSAKNRSETSETYTPPSWSLNCVRIVRSTTYRPEPSNTSCDNHQPNECHTCFKHSIPVLQLTENPTWSHGSQKAILSWHCAFDNFSTFAFFTIRETWWPVMITHSMRNRVILCSAQTIEIWEMAQNLFRTNFRTSDVIIEFQSKSLVDELASCFRENSHTVWTDTRPRWRA